MTTDVPVQASSCLINVEAECQEKTSPMVPGKEFADIQHKVALPQETLPSSKEKPPPRETDCQPETSGSNTGVCMFSKDHNQNFTVGSGDPNSTFVLIFKDSPKPSTSTNQLSPLPHCSSLFALNSFPKSNRPNSFAVSPQDIVPTPNQILRNNRISGEKEQLQF